MPPRRPFAHNDTVDKVRSLISVNQNHVLVKKFTKAKKER